MRSALLGVKGVKRAKVTLKPPEAVVTYDAKRVKIEDLLNAVATAQPPGDQAYSAKVKGK